MKKTLSLLLLTVLLIPIAIAPAVATSPAVVHFTVIYGWPEDQYTRSFDMSVDDTLGTLSGTVNSISGASWSPPGPSGDRIGDYYGGYVTIDTTPKRPTYPPDYVIVITPTASPKPASQTESSHFTFRNLTGSSIYLYQVYVNGKTLDFRLFGGDDKIAFLESFEDTKEGDIRLVITIWQQRDDLEPVYTAEALDDLEKLDITEVVIRSKDKEQAYTTEELRDALSANEG